MSRRAATDADVRRRAFPLVLGNLAPAPFAVLPFTLLTAALLHNDMPGSRLDWWLLSGGVVTAVSLIAVLRWYRSSRQVRENDLERTLAVVSYALLGLHFGMAPWVVAGQQPDLVMMFAMFPAVAGVVVPMVSPRTAASIMRTVHPSSTADLASCSWSARSGVPSSALA